MKKSGRLTVVHNDVLFTLGMCVCVFFLREPSRFVWSTIYSISYVVTQHILRFLSISVFMDSCTDSRMRYHRLPHSLATLRFAQYNPLFIYLFIYFLV